MKQYLIKKIKMLLVGMGGTAFLSTKTHIGDAYSVSYDEIHDGVEVDVVASPGEGISNPSTITVGIEYLTEKEIENILNFIEKFIENE